jgi:peptidoglycan-N-acetylmuramic acid deacetylase
LIESYEVETMGNQNTELYGYDSVPNQKYAWWFKRNDDHVQPEAQKEVDIEQYDAWYVSPEKEEKVVYLTFDCGYENGYTGTMLDVLKKHNAKATFFITAHYAKDAANLVKRMKEEGHYVGNHTAWHPDLTRKSTRDIKLEIKECEDAMYEHTGYAMDPLFRPPKGEYSERVLKIVQDLGYKTLFWSLAYMDYDVNNQPGKEYVVDHYKKYIHPGAIPLIHNVSESNAQALDQVLTDLKAAGYGFGDAMKIGKKMLKK